MSSAKIYQFICSKDQEEYSSMQTTTAVST